jgi:sterol 24-C-methyltransferase
MENHLFKSLNLSAGAIVLDIGCGIGHVAIYMAKKGLRVIGIDIINHHLTKVKRNIKVVNCEQQISIQKMDYYCLDRLPSNSFNGVYTMETLVYITDPKLVLRQFYQVLKPSGFVALHKYNFKFSNAPKYFINTINKINTFVSMLVNKGFN